MHDNRWNNVRLKEGITNEFGSHVYENLELDFEDNPATDYREKGDCLRLASTHLELLTVDKRAFYIMAIEASARGKQPARRRRKAPCEEPPSASSRPGLRPGGRGPGPADRPRPPTSTTREGP